MLRECPGVVYRGKCAVRDRLPLGCDGLSAIAFPYQATGSIIEVDGVKYGSELVGQPFKSDTHLWGRPTVVDAGSFSDAEGQPLLWYSPENLSPASDEFAARVDERIQQVRAAHPDRAAQPVPSDLVTVSGSASIRISRRPLPITRWNVSLRQRDGPRERCVPLLLSAPSTPCWALSAKRG